VGGDGARVVVQVLLPSKADQVRAQKQGRRVSTGAAVVGQGGSDLQGAEAGTAQGGVGQLAILGAKGCAEHSARLTVVPLMVVLLRNGRVSASYSTVCT
jgi:hypothetical protein